MYRVERSQENQRIQADFTTRANDRFQSIQKSVKGYFEVVNSIVPTYTINGNKVDREQFRLIVQNALLRQPDLEVLQWILRVPASRRLEFEAVLAKDVDPDFQISERNSEGKIVRAAYRNEYYPLYYFEPFYIDDSAQEIPNAGFDYASNPILREALYKARDTALVAVTARVKLSRLIREPKGQYGCAFFLPVYQPAKFLNTLEERKLNLAGFIGGIFNIEITVEDALQPLQPAGITIYLYDLTAPPIPEQRILFHHISRLQKGPSPISSEKEQKVDTELQWQKSFEVGGRTWSVLCCSTPAFFLPYSRSGPWIIFSIIMIFTFLLCGFLNNILYRAEQVERVVVKRTAELSQEITERKRAEESVKDRESWLRNVMDTVRSAILVIDADSQEIIDANPGAVEMIGAPKEQIVGKMSHQFISSPDSEASPVADEQRTGDQSEFELLRANGDKIPILKTAKSTTMNNRHYLIESFLDISERKQLEETLRALSLFDELTGIYNRRGFLTLAEQDLKLAKRANMFRLLFFIDLDQMKGINDSLGHQEGDLALKDTASILRKTFRESDIIARIGGDEFVVLALGANSSHADIITSRLQKNVGLHNETANRRFTLSLSLGITEYSPEFSCSIQELISRADSIMYAQKKKRYSPAS